MKRYIRASTKRLPWRVILGWDDGGPESGPIWKADEFLVYAPTKEAAIAEVVDEWVNDPSEYESIDAYPADQEFIDEHASIVDDEYTMNVHKGWLENPEVMYPFKEDIPWDDINFQKQFTSWKQVYDKFLELGDDDEVYKFYKQAEGNPYFERAWIEWNSGSAPVESATSIRYNLPKPWYKKSMQFIKKTFGDDFIEDDKALCEQNGLEFIGYAWNYDTGDYAIVAKDNRGRYNCYFADHSGRMTLIV